MDEYVTDADGQDQCTCPPQCFSRSYYITTSQGGYSDYFLDFLV